MAKMIGTVNGFSLSPAKFGRKAFTFDGTIKGLTISALSVGAASGDTVRANFGSGLVDYKIVSTPWDNRAGGFWASRA